MRLVKLFFVLILGLSSKTFASDGSSGCGAGWYIFKDNSLVSSLLRSYTNVTFSSTFGMTSGTSNCAKHSIVDATKKALYFAENNYPVLVQDLARGSGELVGGLAYAMGCDWRAYDEFSTKIQSNFEVIVPTNDSPVDLISNVHNLIDHDVSLRQQCSGV